MNIIILGPQGSGKGTQAELLAQKFNLEHIDIGGTLRELAKIKTPFGEKIQKIINVEKSLVPDEILNDILKLKVNSLSREQRIVFDGVPRTLKQAEFLDNLLLESGRKIDKVFFVNISANETMKRISKRWMCQKCKSILIMGRDIKSAANKCPRCGGNVYQREDDTPEGVKKRLATFQKETMPVIKYYRGKGILAEIDGKGEIKEVFNKIVKLFENV